MIANDINHQIIAHRSFEWWQKFTQANRFGPENVQNHRYLAESFINANGSVSHFSFLLSFYLYLYFYLDY